MSRHWREKLDPARHRDFRGAGVEGNVIQGVADPLILQWVYWVQVASFRFQFVSLEHLDDCLQHFEQKTHPSSREAGINLEHYWQRWFERLPQWLFEESKRSKVIKALTLAKADFESMK